jgi:3D (Asp-Asp-Asp) domain-containing protein
MMYVRPSQPQAASKARLFKQFARTVLASALVLSLLGPAEAVRIELVAAATDFDWEVPAAPEAVVAAASASRGASDKAAGPELLRRPTRATDDPRGTAILASAWSGPAPSRARLVRMRVTAYCPCDICCGPKAAGITASGHTVAADNGRFVAADPVLSFGTRLVVPGYNSGRPVRVLDRGGAIRGRSLDVYFDDHETARAWGVRYLAVAIMAAR